MQNIQINSPVNYAAMGARIRAARKAKKMTQSQVAQLCDISAAFFGHIERGTRIASVETLIMISRVLQVSLDSLISDSEDKSGGIFSSALSLASEETPFLYDAPAMDEKSEADYCYIRIEKSRLEALKRLFQMAGIKIEEQK